MKNILNLRCKWKSKYILTKQDLVKLYYIIVFIVSATYCWHNKNCVTVVKISWILNKIIIVVITKFLFKVLLLLKYKINVIFMCHF